VGNVLVLNYSATVISIFVNANVHVR
jgi:hypothetical protein